MRFRKQEPAYQSAHTSRVRTANWKRRVHISINVLLILVLLGTLGAFGYMRWQVSRIATADLGGILDEYQGDAMTVLMVGSDTRENNTGDENKKFGSSSKIVGQRSDTIMLLRINVKEKRAAILSIPRDTWVNIAGGGQGKINSAFEKGPKQLAETIKSNFGIPIHHYVQVDFASFKQLVDTLGGVNVYFPAPARDWGVDEATGRTRNLSGLDIPQSGCIKLNGDMALAYVRSRHYQVKEQGRWVADPKSDLGRIQRQQEFIRRVLKQASEEAKKPWKFDQMVNTGVEAITVDSGLKNSLHNLARFYIKVDPSTVKMMTLPTTDANFSNVSALVPAKKEAPDTINTFLYGDKGKPDESSRSVGSVSVRVLNGSGIGGQASEVADGLRSTGFVVSGIGDANQGYAKTTIMYPKGEQASAALLSKYIKGTVELVESKTVTGVSAVLITGQNFQGYNSGGNSAPASPELSSTTTTGTQISETTETTSKFVPSEGDPC